MLNIPFTRDEWGYIANALLDTYDPEQMNDYDYMILSLVDRIEDALVAA